MKTVTVDNLEVFGIQGAMRGMRHPLKSYDKSDTVNGLIGSNDYELLDKLCKAGKSHRKALRQIFIGCDITAPQYFWREYNTYKIGTVENSTSQMHTICKRTLRPTDFVFDSTTDEYATAAFEALLREIDSLIIIYNRTQDKNIWRLIIQLIPQSFKYTKYCTLNYEVLKAIYDDRKNHKLKEWHDFLDEMRTKIHYPELVFGFDDRTGV